MAASMSISDGQAVGPVAVLTKKRKKIAATTRKEKKDGAKEKPKGKIKKALSINGYQKQEAAVY